MDEIKKYSQKWLYAWMAQLPGFKSHKFPMTSAHSFYMKINFYEHLYIFQNYRKIILIKLKTNKTFILKIPHFTYLCSISSLSFMQF